MLFYIFLEPIFEPVLIPFQRRTLEKHVRMYSWFVIECKKCKSILYRQWYFIDHSHDETIDRSDPSI